MEAIGEPQKDRRSTMTDTVSEEHRTGRHEMATKIHPRDRLIGKRRKVLGKYQVDRPRRSKKRVIAAYPAGQHATGLRKIW